MTEAKPSNTIIQPLNQNLFSNPTLADTFIEQIYAGVQVSELLKPNNPYQISLMSFYNQLRKPENKEFNERFTYARQMFLKEKTKFLQWLGEKITDLYGIKSKELINKGTVNNIVVSWLDSPELESKYTQYEKINQAKTEVIDQ